MLTKKVKNRIIFLIFIIFIFIISIFFVLKSLNDSILYFHTPTEINQNRELTNYKIQFDILNKKLNQVENVLSKTSILRGFTPPFEKKEI